MGPLGILIGIIVLGWVSSLLDGSTGEPSKGYHNLHDEANQNHGIALNNCENCCWHHKYVCDNCTPKL